MIFWLVLNNVTNQVVICNARNREYAKSKASQALGNDPDNYIVTPLTEVGQRVYIDVTVV